jgi:hypothetical protein
MSAGCPFITCAIKKKGIEFCWFCKVNNTCEKWSKHKQASKNHDSFKCYQTLETDIEFIKTNGIENFINNQKIRERLLIEMLSDFNATVLQIEELEKALSLAKKEVNHQTIVDIREKSKTLHSILDNIANENNYLLKLRK